MTTNYSSTPLYSHPTLSLVWVAASIGPSLRSPFGRLSSKHINSIDLPHTCSLITHANLPLRISSTLLKGTAIIFRHQCSLHFSTINNIVQHLRLVLSTPYSIHTTSTLSLPEPLPDLLRKSVNTLPERPDLTELTLIPSVSELLLFSPAAMEPYHPEDIELERRRAVTPLSASLLSTADTSLLPEAIGTFRGAASPLTESIRLARPPTYGLDQLREFPEPPEFNMDLDLGLDLPPLPQMPAAPSPLFPSSITLTPEPMPAEVPYPSQFLSDLAAIEEQREAPPLVEREPSRKRRRVTFGPLVDLHLEIPIDEWREPPLMATSLSRSLVEERPVIDRVLGPLISELAPELAETCTSQITGHLTERAPPIAPAAVMEGTPEIEARRALTLEIPTLSSVLMESPARFPETYPWSLEAEIPVQTTPYFETPELRPSLPPISPIGDIPSFISSDIPLPPLSPVPFPEAEIEMLPTEISQLSIQPTSTLEYFNTMEKESNNFLMYTESLMDARNTSELSFNEIIEPAHNSRRAAAQALHHITALATLDKFKVSQHHPYAPIYIHRVAHVSS